MTTPLTSGFVEIDWNGRPVHIEHRWIAPSAAGTSAAITPLIVFLHEGLGSVSMWREFPQVLCDASACRGLVYSRPGYGRSSPRPADERWDTDFLQRQALEVLPAVLAALDVDASQQPLWLLGHSDGGSIALLHAAHHPDGVAGVIVLAPHTFVEDLSIASIEQARQAYLNGSLRAGLARHHDDPDSAFWGWNQAWLNPAFRDWTIQEQIAAIRAPVLAVQGLDDVYGTLAQIESIARQLPQTRLLTMADCGHSPHRDRPQALIAAACDFMQSPCNPLAIPLQSHPHP